MKQISLEQLEQLVVSAEETPVSEDFLIEGGKTEEIICFFNETLSWRALPPRDQMIELAERVIRLLGDIELQVSDNLVAVRRVAFYKSRLFQAMTRRKEAYQSAKLYNRLCPQTASLKERTQSLIFLAKACYWCDNQKGAVDFQREALDLLDKADRKGDLSEQDKKYFNKARTVWAFRFAQNTCQWDEAYKTFKTAHELALQWNDPGLLSDTLILYAEAKMFQGNWKDCEKIGRECAEAAARLPDGPESDYPFWIWGRALVHTGDVERAVTEFDRSIEIAQDIGDAVGLSEALICRAEAHLALGEKEDAVRTAAQAQETAIWAELGLNLANVRLWRAWIELEALPDNARSMIGPLHSSIADFETIGCRSGWACCLGALGYALGLCGQKEESLFYLEQSLKACRQWDMPWHAERAERLIARFK